MLAVMLLFGAALANEPPTEPRLCLTATEVDARILAPLRALERCQSEVLATVDERDLAQDTLGAVALELAAEVQARETAERRVRRAKRGQGRAAGVGAGSVLLVVLLLVLL